MIKAVLFLFTLLVLFLCMNASRFIEQPLAFVVKQPQEQHVRFANIRAERTYDKSTGNIMGDSLGRT